MQNLLSEAVKAAENAIQTSELISLNSIDSVKESESLTGDKSAKYIEVKTTLVITIPLQ